MNFENALIKLKKGNKISRILWTNFNDIQYLTLTNNYTVCNELKKTIDILSPLTSIAMKKNSYDEFITFVLCSSDLLANDWFVVK